ncbi:MAG: regulatory protein RecX [Bacteroidota bacterium]
MNEIKLPDNHIKEAWDKITRWCAYRERCQQEVRNKLYEMKLCSTPEIEELIARLINENFLNELRYASTFAGGKFRINKWGKIKIKIELQKHNLNAYCIKKALETIDEVDYRKTLQLLIERKLKEIKHPNKQYCIQKTVQFCISRGFEMGIIREILED